MPQHKLNINGKTHTVDAPNNMPLLWVLRDLLKMKGTKFGCGKGLCGSCTIHMGGQATRACVLPVSATAGQKITTIEGLAKDGDHPLQKAWQKYNVPQCGYCQPGQIMNAAGLINNKSKPSPKDIDEAMTGNICRCGTYQRIKKAIYFAAHGKEMPA